MDGDRLVALRDALLYQRAVPAPGSDGMMQFTVTATMQAGADDLEDRLPDWRESPDARIVYICAFDAGWQVAHWRVKIALGLPEARGHEAAAALLALEGRLTFDEIAVRLRAAATTPAGGETGTVVPFRRLSPEVSISGAQGA